jgi:D-3-phosphoglycerate dehydrogenase
MQNFRVANLQKLVRQLEEEGVTIVGEMESFENGNYGWILAPQGNKIQLWEPMDSVFK